MGQHTGTAIAGLSVTDPNEEQDTNSQNFSVDIPFELLQHIVEAIAETPEDLATLAAMSSTCWDLAHYCRRYLFSNIHILPLIFDTRPYRSGKRHLRLKTLEELVAANPDIPKYVRTLTVLTHKSNTFYKQRHINILKAFNHVEILTIEVFSFNTGVDSTENWNDIHQDIQYALFQLLYRQRAMLKDLTFKRLNSIPVNLISPLTCVEHLRLKTSSFTSLHGIPDLEDLDNQRTPIRLKSLELIGDRFHTSVSSLFPSQDLETDTTGAMLDLSDVKTFSGTYSVMDLVSGSHPMHILLQDMQQLESLAISGTMSYNVTPCSLQRVLEYLHIDSFNTLHTLQFPVTIYKIRDLIPDNLPTSNLKSIPILPELCDLGISINIGVPVTGAGGFNPLWEDFVTLDTLLCSRRYASLRRVQIKLQFDWSSRDIISVWKSAPNKLLPRLSQKPFPFILTIQFYLDYV